MTAASSPDDAARPRHIVVLGSVNIDLVLQCVQLPQPGQTRVGRDFRCEPGGKGANQAVAAARLGAPVVFVGCVGDDAFGAQSAAGLRAEGVDLTHLSVITGCATGVAMIAVEDSGQNHIVLGPGANAALSVAHVEAAASLIGTAALLICQLESPLAAVQRAITIAQAARVPVWLNPAPAQPLPEALLRQVDLLIPNEGEAALLAGLAANGRVGAMQAAAQLRAAGCGAVLVTLGGEGVLLADAQGPAHHPAPTVSALDTTGAGDTFIGALAAATAEGLGLGAAITFAQQAAAFSVQRRGAQAAMPRRADLAGAIHHA
jgi:ribokinase